MTARRPPTSRRASAAAAPMAKAVRPRMVRPRTANIAAGASAARATKKDRPGQRRHQLGNNQAGQRNRSHEDAAMSVSEPFIRRPIATSLLGIALLIGGALGYWG